MTELSSGGAYHIHRFHMQTSTGTIVCGMVSAVRLQATKNPDLVNCKLCLKKMSKKVK